MNVTWRPSMANLSMLGVSLEACLKVKLLQSIIKTNPFTWSSGSSIMASKERSMARKISTSVYLWTLRGDSVRKGATTTDLEKFWAFFRHTACQEVKSKECKCILRRLGCVKLGKSQKLNYLNSSFGAGLCASRPSAGQNKLQDCNTPKANLNFSVVS